MKYQKEIMAWINGKEIQVKDGYYTTWTTLPKFDFEMFEYHIFNKNGLAFIQNNNLNLYMKFDPNAEFRIKPEEKILKSRLALMIDHENREFYIVSVDTDHNWDGERLPFPEKYFVKWLTDIIEIDLNVIDVNDIIPYRTPVSKMEKEDDWKYWR